MKSLSIAILLFAAWLSSALSAEMPWVKVSADKNGFTLDPGDAAFAPWGFNYDHDQPGRLIEDYWESEWPTIEGDFAEMKKLGANVTRIHLQFGKFMEGPDKPNAKALDRLVKLVELAERTGIYVDLTGLGCYHKKDVPAWYDKLGEHDRWEAQANFWEAVAAKVASSPAIFCYDLMNEPVVPAGRRDDNDWLGPPFGGKHFVQMISLDQQDRERTEIAKAWIARLTRAIRNVDQRHLITVGMVDWSLDRPGLRSGFTPDKVSEDLDFLCVHIYPAKDKTDEALETLKGFRVGKPIVIEETFPLTCSPAELGQFMDRAGKDCAGWIGFYWGVPPEELRQSKELADAFMLGWLDLFVERGKAQRKAR